MDKCFEEYQRWLTEPSLREDEKRELAAISNNEKEQTERFYTELEFGTAGLRGILGLGTNRMNEYVVRRASAGLAAYLLKLDGAKDAGVAIAYDSRRRSDEFAKLAARTLAAYGIRVFLYSTLHSVPQLSFTVRELGCIAGIVITASHNPPEYNGYKVYWSHGGQVGPEQASEILESIRAFDYFDTELIDYELAKKQGLIIPIGTEVDLVYYEKTLSLMLNPDIVKAENEKNETNIVYTPLHGSGLVPVTAILDIAGVKKVCVVPRQAWPDGDFPTVKAPNPEDPNAFKLAIDLAKQVDAPLILATDPDADRLGVAVREKSGEYRLLTGNQIGSLLIYYILSELKVQNKLPDDGFVVKSLVSTSLADAICRGFGVEMRNVLTGFRFIANEIDLAEKSGRGKFLFGFEESYGFLAGGFARDKDAILASLLVCEAATVYASRGKTLLDVLDSIYEEYGCFIEKTKSYTLTGKEGIERIEACMRSLRVSPPSDFGAGETVLRREDFTTLERVDTQSGRVSSIELPESNVLRYILPADAWIVVRPSGTEPKLKLYIGASANSAADAEARLCRLETNADKLISELLGV